MAAAFRPVNNPLPAPDPGGEYAASTTMTPRPTTAPAQPTTPQDEAATPTRASFGAGVLASQRPLPSSPFPESVQVPDPPTPAHNREHSQRLRTSKEPDDVDMDDSDGEATAMDDGAASDEEESVNADGTKSKKKKSQRFYCTDYPPCNLSFTRSEHLARHIRKHTGERPFQCHCSRRFSRLDNLRQHAQTVHLNEEIPMDSLAATGTRFQRQIRTDRVRQPGRARASTSGSIGPGARGHSKSLSTSSITSVSSIASGYGGSDARRRPPPLVMADPRARLPLESFRGSDGQFYRPPSPGDFSTPTSATFSTGQNSPRWGSVMSPSSSHSRPHSMYAGSRTPGRRLSVPSGGSPFQSPHGPGLRGAPFGSPSLNSSNAGAFSPSQGSLLASPTTSTSTWSRRDSFSSANDEAWRRRTWHPDIRDYNGASRLSQVITPSEFPPDTVAPHPPNSANQNPPLRLPGIESFDEIVPLPPPRNPSPMMVDSEVRRPPPPPLAVPTSEYGRDDRRGLAPQWDVNLHRGLTRLDINNTPPRDSAGAWASEANQALLARAEQARVRFEPEVNTVPAPPANAPPPPPSYLGLRHQHTVSAPSFSNPRESRRHGWYNGPLAAAHLAGETIHEGRLHVDRIVHPNISSFQGFPAREQGPPVAHPHHHQPQQQHQQQQQTQQQQQQEQVGMPLVERMERAERMERMERIPERPPPPPPNHHPHHQHQGAGAESPESMKRLEALVAVATGQGPVATAY
ncbi:hypothetical protein N658DRAFT_509529 [Parathielavia hyrcaniae]|uniref:C2H2-type domain-containing protein n=1 Tax=Parathielavia hyrcaniae TaxID=113614 RepID=A0AAN6PV65_9PEZI|nr:hypothetical protein N658DRAFT_509529 [Parathielavia hyrcaniae]